MDSLSGKVGGIDYMNSRSDKLDAILPTNDWRLLAIHKFRKRLAIQEVISDTRTIDQIQKVLIKKGIKNKEQQAIILKILRLDMYNIKKITGIGKYYFNKYLYPQVKFSESGRPRNDLKSVGCELASKNLEGILRLNGMTVWEEDNEETKEKK